MADGIYAITTQSGGSIDLTYINDRFHGKRLCLHVDQSANVKNGEGECNIVITDNEIKDLISLLNGYLTAVNGVPFVVLAENLLHPSVKITIDPNYNNENTTNDKNNVTNSMMTKIFSIFPTKTYPGRIYGQYDWDEKNKVWIENPNFLKLPKN